MVNKALCIGFSYEGTQYSLNGPITDANNMANMFKKFGFSAELYTDKPKYSNSYKANLVNKLNAFLGGLKDYDTAIITLSSHGSLIMDQDMDEIKNADGNSYDQGIVCRGANGNPQSHDLLVDDELHLMIVTQLKDKKNVKILFIVDSCYSGSMCDLQYQYNVDLYIPVGSKIINDQNHVMLISGSTEHQYSYETIINGNIQGVLTNRMIECMNQMHLTNNQMINVSTLYNNLLKNKYFDSLQFPQHPILSSNKTTDFIFSTKQINIPTTSINIPSTSINIPTTSINIPSTSINIPSTSINIPTSSINIPTSSINIPTSSINIPTASINIPNNRYNLKFAGRIKTKNYIC